MASMSDRPGEPIDLPTLANLRELGGWPAADGSRVVAGRLYRSTKLSGLDAADTSRLADRGIGSVVDFRTAVERENEPDRDVPGATNLSLDVLADSVISQSADLPKLMQYPAEVNALLADGGAKQLMAGAYREIVRLPSALASYRAFFEVLDRSDDAVLFHCTTGKDRTGWGAATVLTVLGVSRDDIVAEYLLTNDQLLPRMAGAIDAFAAAGGDPDLIRPVLGVDPDFLQASFDAVQEEFGSMAGYLENGLGLTADRQAALKAKYLA